MDYPNEMHGLSLESMDLEETMGNQLKSTLFSMPV